MTIMNRNGALVKTGRQIHSGNFYAIFRAFHILQPEAAQTAFPAKRSAFFYASILAESFCPRKCPNGHFLSSGRS